MGPREILIVVIGIAITIPISIFEYKRAKRLSKIPFVCPYCGHRFHAKWHTLLNRHNDHRTEMAIISGDTDLEIYTKCPNCKTKGRFKRPWDL